MSGFLVVPILLLVLVAMSNFLLGITTKNVPAHFKPKLILTENELEFFHRLSRALPDYHIFPQVAFSAILTAPKGLSNKQYYAVRGKFSQKYADFVVCEKTTLSIHAVIELDDRTHKANKDAARDKMLESAGYRTIRFKSRNKPSEAEIAALVAGK